MSRKESIDEKTYFCPHGLNKPTVLIGDLHGNRDALRVTLQALGLLSSHKKWKGKGTDLILTGDLLADRIPQDFEVAHFVLKLRQQMAEAGDELIVLLGNHDLEALNFLLGGIGSEPFQNIHLPEDKGREFLRGIRALAQPGLGRKTSQTLPLAEVFQARAGANERFLERVTRTHKGQNMLELIKMLRLWHKAGDTWFQHTPPTPKTLPLMKDPGLLADPTMVTRLFQGTVNLQDASTWFLLAREWTHASNRFERIPRNENVAWDYALEKGVTAFAFGHDKTSCSLSARSRFGTNIQLVGADYGFGKDSADLTDVNAPLSAIYFNPDQTITRGITRTYA